MKENKDLVFGSSFILHPSSFVSYGWTAPGVGQQAGAGDAYATGAGGQHQREHPTSGRMAAATKRARAKRMRNMEHLRVTVLASEVVVGP
jgi:hypothetical protein